MRCHACSAEAVYAPEADGVRVGFCEQHLRDRIATFSAADARAALRVAVRE